MIIASRDAIPYIKRRRSADPPQLGANIRCEGDPQQREHPSRRGLSLYQSP